MALLRLSEGKNCNDTSLTVRLRGVDSKVNYELIDEDSQVRSFENGRRIDEGLHAKPE